MATAIQFLRSSVASLRPAPTSLSDGMPMVNFNAADPGLYFKLNDQSLMKIGPTHISDFAPNNSPAGYEPLSRGEMWLDTSITPDKNRAVLKLWDGTAWVPGGGEILDLEADQPANSVYAGPTAGPDGPPSFRPLESDDLPDNIDPKKLGGYQNGALLIGSTANGFAESFLSPGDGSVTPSYASNDLTLEVTAGNIAGKGGDGTINSGDGHIQLNYGGKFTADNRFKFITATGQFLSQGPSEIGLDPLTDTHTFTGAMTVIGDLELTNVYSLTVGGDAFVGHNMTIGSDTTELLDIYNKTEFYSDVFVKDDKTVDIEGYLNLTHDAVLGTDDTDSLTVNSTTTIPASVTIGRSCVQDTFLVKADTTIECDLTVLGDFSTSGGLVEFPGDVVLGADCNDFVAIQGTLLNKCDILIGPNVPDPNAETIIIDSATGDITTKGDANITGSLVVSDPLAANLFVIDGSTGDATSQGTITAQYFAGDGSQLFNLAVPNAMLFHGDVDATVGPVPANPLPGDFYLNLVTGTVLASWPDIGGTPIQQDQLIYFYDDGVNGKWVKGSVQNQQGFVTINSAQDINGSKTFKAHTQCDETLTVASTKATILGGSLTVHEDTLLKDTLTVEDNKASLLGGTLGVKKETTLFTALDCGNTALTVNGLSDFNCLASFHGGIDMPGNSDLTVGGDLTVLGNTTLGDACTDLLTITATTTINCPTTINNTFTVNAFASELKGTLEVHGITTVRTHIQPITDGAANLGSAALRFQNVYTQDMHFSNEGTKGNDVDGTTGDWTLQEGNDHIYFINNKTGAKFRVVMESVG